ncbi:MAG TPA: hypothetical protein PKD37_07390 [Oligoflexia bacterium]|nr:hypothetical protein [Oligoflexia bacterium]HMP27786.1 hypothetical protein [Oligoflexia bacterium]
MYSYRPIENLSEQDLESVLELAKKIALPGRLCGVIAPVSSSDEEVEISLESASIVLTLSGSDFYRSALIVSGEKLEKIREFVSRLGEDRLKNEGVFFSQNIASGNFIVGRMLSNLEGINSSEYRVILNKLVEIADSVLGSDGGSRQDSSPDDLSLAGVADTTSQHQGDVIGITERSVDLQSDGYSPSSSRNLWIAFLVIVGLIFIYVNRDSYNLNRSIENSSAKLPTQMEQKRSARELVLSLYDAIMFGEQTEKDLALDRVTSLLRGETFEKLGLNKKLLNNLLLIGNLKSLPEADLERALKLTFAPLLEEEQLRDLSLSGVGAEFSLAVLGSYKISGQVAQFDQLDINVLKKLSSPYGEIFQMLLADKDLKIQSAQDGLLRIIANLLLEEDDERQSELLESFLESSKNELLLIKKLRVIMPALRDRPSLLKSAQSWILANSKLLGLKLRWFEEQGAEDLAVWSKHSLYTKLSLTIGILPTAIDFSFEQLADLLRFGSPQIGKYAVSQLKERFFKDQLGRRFVDLVANEKYDLSRVQTVTLLAALALGGDQAAKFLPRWFDSRPDANAVFELLAMRSDMPADDLFNLMATKYLSSTDWSVTLSKIKLLLGHREPLARALGISKLAIDKPEEVAILRSLAVNEPSEKLRGQIAERLALADQILIEPTIGAAPNLDQELTNALGGN